MSIPGFTADAGVGPTKEVYQVYRTQAQYGLDAAQGLLPQQWGGGALGSEWYEELGDDAAMEVAGDDLETGLEGLEDAAMEMAGDDFGAGLEGVDDADLAMAEDEDDAEVGDDLTP